MKRLKLTGSLSEEMQALERLAVWQTWSTGISRCFLRCMLCRDCTCLAMIVEL